MLWLQSGRSNKFKLGIRNKEGKKLICIEGLKVPKASLVLSLWLWQGVVFKLSYGVFGPWGHVGKTWVQEARIPGFTLLLSLRNRDWDSHGLGGLGGKLGW